MNPAPGPAAAELRARLMVWWFLWGGMLASLLSVGAVFGFLRAPEPPGNDPLLNLVGLVPLFVSIVIRWLVLPRGTQPKSALVMFLLGLGLADTCGLLGIFLGGPYRDDLFILGVLGILQFAPFFARRLHAPPGGGFRSGA